MNTRFAQVVTTALFVGVAAAVMPACSQEVAHTESDKQGWFGSQKHTEDTTYQNPDGSLSHEHKETTVK